MKRRLALLAFIASVLVIPAACGVSVGRAAPGAAAVAASRCGSAAWRPVQYVRALSAPSSYRGRFLAGAVARARRTIGHPRWIVYHAGKVRILVCRSPAPRILTVKVATNAGSGTELDAVGVRRKARPSATATVLPRPASTPTPSLTPSPTTAPEPTATATATTRPYQQVTMALSVVVPAGDRAAFYACSLPPGVVASFSPPVSVSGYPPNASTPQAQANLTLDVPPSLVPAAYSFPLRALVQDSEGRPVSIAPEIDLQPYAATLTVSPGGVLALSPAAVDLPTAGETCTPLPPDFAPTPTPTISPSQVQVRAWISDAHPAPGEVVTVYGQITAAGRPVDNAVMRTRWYLPNNIDTCDTLTDPTGTGTCSRANTSIPGQTVAIQVEFEYLGTTFTAVTSYTS